MTPKEKAKELVDKFDEFTIHHSWRFKNDDAIECALIAVDEIINSTHSYQYMLAADLFTRKTFKREYWQEVKQEIEKL